MLSGWVFEGTYATISWANSGAIEATEPPAATADPGAATLTTRPARALLMVSSVRSSSNCRRRVCRTASSFA